MPEFKEKGRGFKMKGFSPYTKAKSPYYATDDDKKKGKMTKEMKLLKKQDESMLEFHDRVKKAGLTKQATEIKSQMDKDYKSADWDKE
tara:strand:- start:1379 stop:1642 length:264 start_codon:yes stop_codon:yes gene_type:complete